MGRPGRMPRAGCAFLWSVAASAQEPPRYEIEFDLTDSVVVAGGLIEIPPDGAIGSGSLLLSVPASEAGDDVLPGPAEISDLTFSLTTDSSRFGTTLAGPFAAVQQGTVAGTLSDAMDEVVLSSPLFLDRNGTISCDGWFCWLFGDTFPLVLGGVESIPPPATLKVANLGELGGATLSDTIAVTMNSGTAVFRIAGEERRRRYVPEPHTTAMTLAGCVALALLERRRGSA